MFGFFKKKTAPPPKRSSNPGLATTAKLSLSNGQRNWTEEVDFVRAAADVFARHGHSIANESTFLHHRASGYLIQPQIAEVQLLDDGGVRTVTTIQVNHPSLTPDGLFEYQHSAGGNFLESVSKGFDQWVQTDFVTLLEATLDKPGKCTQMQMEFPARDGKPAKARRVILGPVSHYAQSPPTPATPEEHPFCACCLLTRSFEAFKEFIEGDGFFGLRLYAARDQNGQAAADCRINGDEYEPGKEALRKYVATWPAAGFEFRKQYVVIQLFASTKTAKS